MIVVRIFLALLLICSSTVGNAYSGEEPLTTDSRIKTYVYSPNEVFSSNITWKYYGADITEDNITSPTSIPLFTESRNLTTPSYSLVDINVKWSFDKKTTASLYVKNATDKTYARSNFDSSVAGFFSHFYQPPREAGLIFSKSF